MDTNTTLTANIPVWLWLGPSRRGTETASVDRDSITGPWHDKVLLQVYKYNLWRVVCSP